MIYIIFRYIPIFQNLFIFIFLQYLKNVIVYYFDFIFVHLFILYCNILSFTEIFFEELSLLDYSYLF